MTEVITAVIGGIAVVLAALIAKQGHAVKKQVREVHREVASPNGSTTGAAIQDIKREVSDIREQVQSLDEAHKETFLSLVWHLVHHETDNERHFDRRERKDDDEEKAGGRGIGLDDT